MMMVWFGRSWGAPILQHIERVATPVGEPCSYCEEAIGAEDSGLIIPHIEFTGPKMRAQHRECFVRQVIGSVVHQEGLCGCKDRTAQADLEEGLTRREAAKRAEIWFNATHQPTPKTLN